MMDRASAASSALREARHQMNASQPGRALAYFLIALQAQPDCKKELREEFALAFQLGCDQLLERRQLEDLFYIYEQVGQVYPENDLVCNVIGSQLFRCGYVDEAVQYYQRACAVNPSLCSARENLDNILCHLVSQWHFRMLNDSQRNMAFQHAIHSAVTSGKTRVLDIGSGTGLLSMFACQSQAQHVFACEESATMYKLSQDVLAANQMSDQVHVINKNSADLDIPADIPISVDLIVTETVDCGLLGEKILSTLSHAWKCLLSADKSPVVIPGKAVVFCALIECEEIRKHHNVELLAFRSLDLCNVIFMDYTSQLAQDLPDASLFDPYTTYDLNRIRGGYSLLTKPCQALVVDFNSEQNIDRLLHGHHDLLNLEVTQSGQGDAIAMWFDLYVDEATTLSTSMLSQQSSCWHPAVYPVIGTKPYVRHGESFPVQLAVSGDCLRLSYCPSELPSSAEYDAKALEQNSEKGIQTAMLSPADMSNGSRAAPQQNATMSFDSLTLHDAVLLHGDAHQRNGCVHDEKMCDGGRDGLTQCSNSSTQAASRMFFIPTKDIYRMNCIKFNTLMCSAISTARNLCPKRPFRVLDMTHSFSTLAIQASKLGADEAAWISSNTYHVEAVNRLCELNGVTNVKATHDAGNGFWDCIMFEVVDADGTLKQHVVNDIAIARLTQLAPCGVIIPCALELHAICINSTDLLESSTVIDDSRTLGLKIAPFINNFQPATQRDIDMKTLSYKNITHPVHLLTIDLGLQVFNNQGLPSFASMQRSVTMECIHEEGPITVDAVVYWFEMKLTSDVTVSTLDSSYYWRQAAFIPKKRLSVTNHDRLAVMATISQGYLAIDVDTKHTVL